MARKRTAPKRRPVAKKTRTPAFLGRWEVIEAEDSGGEPYADDPGAITFEAESDVKDGGMGQLQVGCLEAQLDWRGNWASGLAEFTWEGFEEGDQVSGRGTAWPDEDGRLHFAIRHHLGDEFSFICEKTG